MKKSYHSMVVPTRLAAISRGMLDGRPEPASAGFLGYEKCRRVGRDRWRAREISPRPLKRKRRPSSPSSRIDMDLLRSVGFVQAQLLRCRGGGRLGDVRRRRGGVAGVGREGVGEGQLAAQLSLECLAPFVPRGLQLFE